MRRLAYDMESTTSDTSGGRRRVALVDPDPRYARPQLVEPSAAGFLHLAVESHRRSRPGPLFGRDERRDRVLAQVTAYARAVAQLDDVQEATAFKAVLIPPVPEKLVQPDVALLVRTAAPHDAVALRETPELRELLGGLAAAGARTHVLAARNARRIGDVDHARPDLFLFNHFLADDRELAIELWERLAAWYGVETGLDNSVLLAPVEGERSDFAIVNHARFADSLLRLALQQFAKRSFYTYVRANMRANRVTAVPVLYRLGRAP
jgi:hypothetical protein